jgi:xanthine dehydrogenase accessory factor
MDNLILTAAEFAKSEESIAFVTIVEVIGSVPQIPGAKMLVVDKGDRHLTFGTIGGGALEHIALEEALEAIREGEVRYYKKDLGKDLNMACGGKVTYLIEPLQKRKQLVICGAGHIGKAIYSMTRELDFRTVLIDSMEEYANEERFPGVESIITSFDEQVIEDALSLDDHSYIVIVSRDHTTDFRLARYFLKKEWKYLGLIASGTKAAKLRKELKQEGYEEEKISRMVSPIGIPIGGSSPGEIAVGIVAQLVEVMNHGK